MVAAAAAALEEVRAGLASTPPQLIQPDGKSHRAAVGILLRPRNMINNTNNSNEDSDLLEALFMLRATNPNDRWSGQVSFPGGRQEKGETDLETAKREVLEEVGINIDTAGFKLLGRVHDRIIHQGGGTSMVVCAFVFGTNDVGHCVQVGELDPEEVSAAAWCPLKALCTDEYVHKQYSPVLKVKSVVDRIPMGKVLLPMLGLSSFCFTQVNMPMVDVVMTLPAELQEQQITHGSSIAGQRLLASTERAPEFRLWGLTLGIINDLLHSHLGWISKRIALYDESFSPLIRTDMIYGDAPVHNLMLHCFRRAGRLVSGRELTWPEFVCWYPITVVASSTSAYLAAHL